MEKEREADAKAGSELAQVLEGHIKRKIIKQTVMTTVYGVTRFGARLQIDKQLKGVLATPYFPFSLHNYLALGKVSVSVAYFTVLKYYVCLFHFK